MITYISCYHFEGHHNSNLIGGEKSTMAKKHANKPTDSRYVKGSRYYGEAGYINYRDWTSPDTNKPTDSRYVKGSRYYGEAGYINYRDWTSPYQPTSTPSRNDMRYGESLYRDGATQAEVIAEEHGIRAMIDQIERKRRGIGI